MGTAVTNKRMLKFAGFALTKYAGQISYLSRKHIASLHWEMANMNTEQKYIDSHDFFKREPDWSYARLMVALCLIKLQKYESAKNNCLVALENCSFRGGPGYQTFIFTSQIEKLPELFVFSGQPESFHKTLITELNEYKKDERGKSLISHYAYALQNLLYGEDVEALTHCEPLVKRPKIKDMFAIGETIRAIVEKDQQAFDKALDLLLLAHRGMAKQGSLRESPEGFLSMPGISLSYIAYSRGLSINTVNEYLPVSYLDFLNK